MDSSKPVWEQMYQTDTQFMDKYDYSDSKEITITELMTDLKLDNMIQSLKKNSSLQRISFWRGSGLAWNRHKEFFDVLLAIPSLEFISFARSGVGFAPLEYTVELLK